MTTKKQTKTSISKKTVSQNQNFEKRIDWLMSFLQNKLSFIKDFMELDFIKKILSSKIIEDTNKWVKTNLVSISNIIGWVIVVFWILWLLTTLWTMWIMLRYFGSGFVLLFLLNIVYILIWILLGFGLIKMKNRVPFFVTFLILLDLAYIIIVGLLFWFSIVPSPRTIIFYIIFAIYIIKNKSLFNQ